MARVYLSLGSNIDPESNLKLAIRVHGSPARACEELERFLERSDPPAYLAARIGSWVADLSDLEGDGELPVTLASARELIGEGAPISTRESASDRR